MPQGTQPDLFGVDQPELFDLDVAPPVTHADPERVRAWLRLIIAEARTAERLPWDARKVRLYRTIVPQMALWLPDDEAALLRFEFETELARLEAA